MDDAEVGRRVAAARKRAGIAQRKELTDAAELPRVGPATLGKIERGERHLFPHEADVFARVLGVDRSFFYEEDGAEASELAQRLEQIERKLDLIMLALGVIQQAERAEVGDIPELPDALRRTDEDRRQAP